MTLRKRQIHLLFLLPSPPERHHVRQAAPHRRPVLHGGGRDHHGPGQAPAHARPGRPLRRADGAGNEAQAQVGFQELYREGGDTDQGGAGVRGALQRPGVRLEPKIHRTLEKCCSNTCLSETKWLESALKI